MKNLIQSNPKPLEEYSKMFNLIYEVADEFEKTIIEYEDIIKSDNIPIDINDEAYIKTHLKKYAYEESLQSFNNIYYDKSGSLSHELRHYVDAILLQNNVLSFLEKNNQIEQIVKMLRAMIARNLYLVCHNISTDTRSLPEWLERKVTLEESQYWISKSPKLKSLLEKLYNRYIIVNGVHPNLVTLNLLKPFKDDVFPRFIHMKSVLDNNPNFVRVFNQIDFSNLRVSEFEDVLDELERKVEESKDSSLVYEGEEEKEYQKLLKRESDYTSLYMKVDDEYSWYLIDAPRSEMEAFLGSKGSGSGTHCGVPSDGENCMFSLRSINEKGQFVLHATCSAHYYETDNGGKIYCLVQMRSRRNHAIPPKLWPYMYALYASDEIVSEASPSYSSHSSFLSDWFNELPSDFKYSEKEEAVFKKMHNEIISKKPYLKHFKKAIYNMAKKGIIYKYVDHVMFGDFNMRYYISYRLIRSISEFYNIENYLTELSTLTNGSTFFELEFSKFIDNNDIMNLLTKSDSNFLTSNFIKDFEESLVYVGDDIKKNLQSIKSIIEKIKTKIKSKKMSKKHLVKVLDEIVEIGDDVVVLKFESVESFNSVTRNTFDYDSALKWVIRKASDSFDDASQYVDDNVDLRVFPENHRNEHDTNLKEVLEYLQSFEERTGLQVYSPIENEYNQTEMILTMDEFFYYKIIAIDKEDFYETLDDCITRAYRDQMTSSCESAISESCYNALDGHIVYSEDSENEIMEFETNWNDGTINIILRINDNNIEDIVGDDEFEIRINGLPNLKKSRSREFENIDYYAEFNFESFTDYLHENLWSEFK